MRDLDVFDALLADLRSLVKQAHTQGEEYDLKDSRQPHYWHGVKVGYEDSADRLEALLQQNFSAKKTAPKS